MTDDDPLAVLYEATRVLRSERRELEDEREAFSQFRTRVGALETTASTARPPTDRERTGGFARRTPGR